MSESQRSESVAALVLCGGAGTRLWPLSRLDRPKQFWHSDAGGFSLFQRNLLMLQDLGIRDIRCATVATYLDLARGQAESVGVSCKFLVEDFPAGTAFAVLSGAANILKDGYNRTLVIPADHVFEGFASSFENALEVFEVSNPEICCFGISKDIAAERFSVLCNCVQLDNRSDGFRVSSFNAYGDAIPSSRKRGAQQLINSGAYLFDNDVILTRAYEAYPEFDQVASRQFDGKSQNSVQEICLKSTMENLQLGTFDSFLQANLNRIYAVRHSREWSALESWSAFKEIALSGVIPGINADMQDTKYVVDGKNVLIKGLNRLVATVGLSNLMIIDTMDALLVVNINDSGGVKELVGRLEKDNRRELIFGNSFERPWGSYEILTAGNGFQVKRIRVNPGQRLSLQKHFHRCENWIVVSGRATVEVEGQVSCLGPKGAVFIPVGHVHRLSNLGDELLEVIEVQSGDYLGEDDIVRLEDGYGRI